MSNHWKDELMSLVGDWDVVKINHYIETLEVRMQNTKDQIRALKELRRKKWRKGPKDTGERGGK